MESLLIVIVGAVIAFLWCCRWRTFAEDSNCPAVFEIVTVRTDDGIFCEAKYLDDGLWMPAVNVPWRVVGRCSLSLIEQIESCTNEKSRDDKKRRVRGCERALNKRSTARA